MLIRTNGSIRIGIRPENGTDFSLKELYELIECDIIQIVQLDEHTIMIVDENGIANKKELNEGASSIYKETREPPEVTAAFYKQIEDEGWNIITIPGNEQNNIFGNALVCPRSMIK